MEGNSFDVVFVNQTTQWYISFTCLTKWFHRHKSTLLIFQIEMSTSIFFVRQYVFSSCVLHLLLLVGSLACKVAAFSLRRPSADEHLSYVSVIRPICHWLRFMDGGVFLALFLLSDMRSLLVRSFTSSDYHRSHESSHSQIDLLWFDERNL